MSIFNIFTLSIYLIFKRSWYLSLKCWEGSGCWSFVLYSSSIILSFIRLKLLTFCFIECNSVQCCREGKYGVVFVFVVTEIAV